MDHELDLIRSALSGECGQDQQLIAQEFVAMLVTALNKNRDYGSSVFEPSVLAPHLSSVETIKVRASDKIKRLSTLLSGKKQHVMDETIADTRQDLAVYMVLWGIAEKRKDRKEQIDQIIKGWSAKTEQVPIPPELASPQPDPDQDYRPEDKHLDDSWGKSQPKSADRQEALRQLAELDQAAGSGPLSLG